MFINPSQELFAVQNEIETDGPSNFVNVEIVTSERYNVKSTMKLVHLDVESIRISYIIIRLILCFNLNQKTHTIELNYFLYKNN